MKRNIYSFLMAAALCGAVSCSDKISTETPEGAGYITVTSQVGAQTKAGYETKTLPADFVMEVNQGAAAEYDYYVLIRKMEHQTYITNLQVKLLLGRARTIVRFRSRQ